MKSTKQIVVLIAILWAVLIPASVQAGVGNLVSTGKQLYNTVKTSQLVKDAQIEKAKYDSLKNSGYVFTAPIGFKAASGSHNLAFNVLVDTVRCIRGTQDTTTVDDRISFDGQVLVQFPTSADTSCALKFVGQNIILRGRGTSKIYLANTQNIPISKNKITLRINKDSTYLTYTCAGVQSVHMCGAFIFDNSFLYPSDAPKDTLIASFCTEVNDWDDMLMTLDFNKQFSSKLTGGFKFKVTQAVADYSSISNADGFSFPAGYDTASYANDLPSWMGFAIKELQITMPRQLSFRDSSIVVDAKNVLIDETGITGDFMATNVLPINKKSTAPLRIGIDTIAASFMQNVFVKGAIAGNVEATFLTSKTRKDSALALHLTGKAAYDKAADSLFISCRAILNTNEDYGVPFCADLATISIYKNSRVDYVYNHGHNDVSLVLNGKLTIKGEFLIKDVSFEGLCLSTASSVSCHKFSLTPGTMPNLGGFGLQLTKLNLDSIASGSLLNIGSRISLLSEDLGISAAAGFKIYSVSGSSVWKFKSLAIDSISLKMDFSAFRFDGSIGWFKNSPSYGNGFSGHLQLDLKALNIGFGAIGYFGKKSTYKYWGAQISADLGGKIMIFPTVMLKSIKGGAYHYMKNNAAYSQDSVDLSKTFELTPDSTVNFGFQAGVGLCFMQESLISAEVLLEMAFNNNWGLKYIALYGQASVLSKNVKHPTFIGASLKVFYDRDNRMLNAMLDAKVDVIDVLTGTGKIMLHTEPGKWYCYLGTHSSPIDLDFAHFLDVKTYFMMGQIPTSLPPLNEEIELLFDEPTHSTAEGEGDKTLTGKGFAFGMNLKANCGFGKKKGFVFAYITLDGGIDALVIMNHNDTLCGGDWRAYGRAFVYVDADAGVRIHKKKHVFLELEAATVLEAEMPRPVYVSGKIAFRYRVLFFKGKIKRHYAAGKHCS